jgi:NADPH:quinone reductase-like Zn-dependent oxidoreductase
MDTHAGVGLTYRDARIMEAKVRMISLMKSIRIHSFGDNSVVRVEEIDKPVPGPGEFLIRVAAAAVNPVDLQIRGGKLEGFVPHTLPLTLGCDVTGTVESGDGFKAGDSVYAYLNLARLGAFAEFAIVKTEEASLAPKSLDAVHAAAVPVAALTAWQALFDHANLEFGQTVLIHGASGSVGSMAVQLAKWKGAHVIATASESNREYVGAFGADEFIDYKSERFEDIVSDADVVFDTVGGDTQERSFGVLKPGGILVSVVSPPSEEKAKAAGVRAMVMGVQPNGKRLSEIAALFDDGILKTLVENKFPLADAAKAMELSAKGGARGKIVLIVG